MLDNSLVKALSHHHPDRLISDLECHFSSGYMPLWLCDLYNNETIRTSKEELLMDIEWYIIRKLRGI